jgi:predicted DCC family thiol-disulfide oxidoreductase YuxK
MTENKTIILFDGTCHLCTGSVRFILRRDRRRRFLFASLQSDAGRELGARFGLAAHATDSFICVEGDEAYQRSTAALHVARQLGGLWKLLYVLIAVPRFLRDGVYDWVAQNRHAWFGRTEVCLQLGDEEKERFLA